MSTIKGFQKKQNKAYIVYMVGVYVERQNVKGGKPYKRALFKNIHNISFFVFTRTIYLNIF